MLTLYRRSAILKKFSKSGPLVKRSKTPPFHGGYTGSNPVRVTKQNARVISSAGRAPALQAGCWQFDPVIAHHPRSLKFEIRGSKEP